MSDLLRAFYRRFMEEVMVYYGGSWRYECILGAQYGCSRDVARV
jgi:hypothetical protein